MGAAGWGGLGRLSPAIGSLPRTAVLVTVLSPAPIRRCGAGGLPNDAPICARRVATKRSYHDSCGLAHALDLVGERWALLVVRELMFGPKRFTELRADLPRVSANVLTRRLVELEAASVVRRRKLPPPAASWVYELTVWGLELEPVIRTLGRWAARSPKHRRDLSFGVAALILSLRTNFDPALASGVRLDVLIRCGEQTFLAEVADGGLVVERWTGEPPAATEIAGEPPIFATVIYGGRPLGDAVAAGDLTVSGDVAAARNFVRLFTLPEPAAPPIELGGARS